MLIIICGMIPSSIILPQRDLTLSIIQLQSTWQISGLFLTSLICGPQIGTVSAISYIIIGLFYLPVFHGGGSIGYILTPEFGYLLGFIPSAFICGLLANIKSKANFINFTLYTSFSLIILHSSGIIYLILGNIFGSWRYSLIDLILINTIIPLPSQLILCIATSLLSIIFRQILIIK